MVAQLWPLLLRLQRRPRVWLQPPFRMGTNPVAGLVCYAVAPMSPLTCRLSEGKLLEDGRDGVPAVASALEPRYEAPPPRLERGAASEVHLALR